MPVSTTLASDLFPDQVHNAGMKASTTASTSGITPKISNPSSITSLTGEQLIEENDDTSELNMAVAQALPTTGVTTTALQHLDPHNHLMITSTEAAGTADKATALQSIINPTATTTDPLLVLQGPPQTSAPFLSTTELLKTGNLHATGSLQHSNASADTEHIRLADPEKLTPEQVGRTQATKERRRQIKKFSLANSLQRYSEKESKLEELYEELFDSGSDSDLEPTEPSVKGDTTTKTTADAEDASSDGSEKNINDSDFEDNELKSTSEAKFDDSSAEKKLK